MNPAIDTNLDHLRTVIRQHKPKPPVTLEKSPVLSHGWLLPYLLEADMFLWQRWQHWYETAMARKLVAPIPIIEWQKDEAGQHGRQQSRYQWVVQPYPAARLQSGQVHPAQRVVRVRIG